MELALTDSYSMTQEVREVEENDKESSPCREMAPAIR